MGLRRPADERSGRPPVRGWRVLVTGASSGIGEATARVLAERGARLAVAGRDRAALAAVAEATAALAIPGDLTVPGTAQATVAAAADALGGLDLLVSNAGVGWTGPFAEMLTSDIDTLLDLNLRAAAHLVHAALPHLRAAAASGGCAPLRSRRCQPGRVVLIGSIAGEVGVPGEAWYSATKAGLAGFAAALRSELRPEGVAVSLVIPGVVDTRFLERRALPYRRRRPRPLPAAAVATALLDAVEHGSDEALVPAWLTIPARLHGALPGLYRLAARLAGA
jgi:short-subunit dehydrogenase